MSNAAFKVRQQISISRHWRSSQFALPRSRIRIPERSPADHEVGVPISRFSLITAIEYSVNDASFVGRGEKKRGDGGVGEAGTAVAHEEEVDEVDGARREAGGGRKGTEGERTGLRRCVVVTRRNIIIRIMGRQLARRRA